MSKWKLSLAATVALAAVTQTALADDNGGQFGKRYYGSVEGVYWLGASMNAGSNGSFSSTAAVVGTEQAANFQPKGGGVRATVGMALPNSNLDVFARYSYGSISGDKTSTVNVYGDIQTTSSSASKIINLADVNTSMTVLATSSARVRLFGGLQFVDVDQKSKSSLQIPYGTTGIQIINGEERDKGWGLGTLALTRNLSLRVMAAVSLLNFERDTTVRSDNFYSPASTFQSNRTESQSAQSSTIGTLIELGTNLDYTIPLGSNSDLVLTIGYTAIDLQNRGITIAGSGGSIVPGSSNSMMIQGVSAGVGLRW
jgi:hypothetical protein